MPTCGTCAFFDEQGYLVYGPDSGLCRIYPPRAAERMGQWPVVRRADWCGAYQTVAVVTSSGTAR
jgi:hypothetical protein